MAIVEGRMELGGWSVTLRDDSPLSLRELLYRWWSHIVITPAWVDPSQLSDAAVLAAARYSGVAMNVGPQRRLGGVGTIWWLGDPESITRYVGYSFSSATYATVYETLIGEQLKAGSYATGGSYSTPRVDGNLRQQLDRVIRATGHEWRVNADFTFDAGTRDDLYGTVPTVVLVEGGGGRDLGLVGLNADIRVDGPDYTDWVKELQIYDRGGYGGVYVGTSPASATPYGQPAHTPRATLDLPDCPDAVGQTVANLIGPSYNEPRYEIVVEVDDDALVEHVRCGDLVWAYDEIEGVRDPGNQVTYGGRVIWPKLMRVERMSWPVRQGMGVYWREDPTDVPGVVYHDLTPYVEWETGNATLELVEGQQKKYYLNPDIFSGVRSDPVAAARDIVRASPWDTYTPAWTSSATAPSVGNGVIVGGWRREGSTLFIRGHLTVGSTSTVGTGHLRLALPASLVGVAAQIQSLPAWWYDASTSFVYPGTALLETSAAYVNFVFSGRSDDRFPTSALATSDQVSFGGTVELTT